MTKVVFWQMLLGTLALIEQLAWAMMGHEPQFLILGTALALLGGGTIQQIGIGKGGGNDK